MGGQVARYFVNDDHVTMTKYTTSVKTADGASQRVHGHLDTDIEFRGIRHKIRLYLIPSLSQDLYLGVDFWKAFQLVPHIIGLLSLSEEIETPVEPKMHQLSSEDRARLELVKRLFLSYTKQDLGKTQLLEHIIDVGEAIPIKQRHYPVSPAVQKLMDAELERMKNLGVIEESQSPWSSPVVLVRKPGKVRLCFDARKVNAVTKKDAYPLPHIDGILGRLPPARYITGLDLKDAFWQIPLERTSREKTAFTVPGHPLYQFTVMPFGLCNAPQTMCRLMDKVIPPDLKETVFVYLDDLLVVSRIFPTT